MILSFSPRLRCLPWLPLLAALVLAGCSETQTPRIHPVTTIAGTASYRERMALPPDAELVVLLYKRTPDGRLRVAEERTPTRGNNVPLPFRLVGPTESTAPYEVEAVILSNGTSLFATPAPIPVQPAQGNVDLWLRRVTEADPAAPSVPVLAGTPWMLTELGGKPVEIFPGQPQPQLLFAPVENGVGRVSGSDGCNSLVGTYALSGTGIRFDHMGSTMKLCPQGEAQARALAQALSRTESVRLAGNRLELLTPEGRIATFEAGNR